MVPINFYTFGVCRKKKEWRGDGGGGGGGVGVSQSVIKPAVKKKVEKGKTIV